jgi:hypothetical protein
MLNALNNIGDRREAFNFDDGSSLVTLKRWKV